MTAYKLVLSGEELRLIGDALFASKEDRTRHPETLGVSENVHQIVGDTEAELRCIAALARHVGELFVVRRIL